MEERYWRGRSQRPRSASPIGTVPHHFQSHMTTLRAGPHPQIQPTTITQKSPFSLISQYECHSRNSWISKLPPPATMWPLLTLRPLAQRPVWVLSQGLRPFPQQTSRKFEMRIRAQATPAASNSNRKARHGPGAHRDHEGLWRDLVLVGKSCGWTSLGTKYPG